jgi:hypothetical protein
MEQNLARYILFMELLPLNLTSRGKLTKPSIVQRLVRATRWLQLASRRVVYYAILIPNKLGLARMSVAFRAIQNRDFKDTAWRIGILSSAYCFDARPIHLSAPQCCSVCTADSDIFVHPSGVCASCWLHTEQLIVERIYLFRRSQKREWQYLLSLLLKRYRFSI